MAELKVEDVLNIVAPGFEIPADATEEEVKEKFKNHFESTFIGKDLHEREVGAKHGQVKQVAERKARQILEKLGVDPNDLKGKNFDALYAFGETKADEIAAEIKVLKDSNKPGDDKKAIELQKKLDGLTELSNAKDQKILSLEDQLAKTKEEYEGKIYNKDLNTRVSNRYDSAPWADGIPNFDIVKKGIWADIQSKYIIKLEGDKELVYNNDTDQTMVKDGNASQMTLEKLLDNILTEKKLKKQNNGTQKPITTPSDTNLDGSKKSKAQLEHEAKINARLGTTGS
jgi:hypothetical protein